MCDVKHQHFYNTCNSKMKIISLFVATEFWRENKFVTTVVEPVRLSFLQFAAEQITTLCTKNK